MKQIFLFQFRFVWNNQSGTNGSKTQLLPNLYDFLTFSFYLCLYPPAHYAITYMEAAFLWMHRWCMCVSSQLRNILITLTGTRLWYGWLGLQEKPRINKSLLSHCGGRVAVFFHPSILLYRTKSPLWYSVTYIVWQYLWAVWRTLL